MAYVGLGSNLGDRRAWIESALVRIDELPGTRVRARSMLENTRPLGPVSRQPMFLNTVAALHTLLGPLELLEGLLGIEQALGRVRGERWGPRTIDLDILLYDDRTIDHPRLRVPHPELWNRPFVLTALKDLHAF